MEQISKVLREKNIRLVGADPFTGGGYTQIPNAILASKTLSDAAKVAYALLLSYAWQNDFCFPGQVTMAERWGKSERSVRTALKELEAAGYLNVKRQGLGRVNIYELHVRVSDGRISDQRSKA